MFSIEGKGRYSKYVMNKEKIDYSLALCVGAFVCFGLVMVYSSSFIFAQERTGDGFSFLWRQTLVALMGFAAMIGVSRIEYRKWLAWAYPVLGIAMLLLILVMIPGIGSRVGGAQRWIRLGFLNLQPGEIAKFACVLFVSRQLYLKRDRLKKFSVGIVSPFLVPLPILALLLAQPDFGSTVIICAVVFTLMFVAGVPKRYLGSLFLLLGTLATWLALSTPYRRARVMAFWDPWSDPGGKGFQVIQSMLGLFHGNFVGLGLGNGKEKLFYLPEAHNDFIFAVIGEELGFVGVALVVGAFLYFTYRGFKIGVDCMKQNGDLFGSFLAIGITLNLSLRAFVNMAVVMGLLPTKGLTLPFISYGGSALLVDLFTVGILLSISKSTRTGKA